MQYAIKLRNKLAIAFLLTAVFFESSYAQEANFRFTDDLCKDETYYLENISTNSERYEWDFCPSSLSNLADAEELLTLTEADFPNAVTIVYDSTQWYGFVSNRGNNKLLRLDFGNSLDNVPSVTDLGDLNGTLKVPKNLVFFQESERWYALLINNNSSTLLRLRFPQGLKSKPEVTNLGNLSSINGPFGLDIGVDDGNVIAFVTNFRKNNISIINFGSSITNNPSSSDVLVVGESVDLSQPFGIKVKKEQENWYGLVSSYGNNKVFKISFGASLFSSPTFVEETTNIVRPTEIEFFNETSNQEALIVSRNNGLYVLEFGNGISEPISSVSGLGNFGLLTDVRSVDLAKEGGDWRGFIANSNNEQFYQLRFRDDCNFVLPLGDTTTNPVVTYRESGTYPITLTAYDEFGNRDDTTQFITVTEDQASLINFELSSQCFGSTSTIIATADQTLTSTDWSITNDSNITETRTGETITYDFPSPGTYTVTLGVESTNGCGNRLTQEITIYEPPTPAFTAPTGLICTNNPVRFTNTTDAKGADVDSLITYRWFVDDELVSDVAEPNITFAEGGNRTVRLEASIPGCTEVAEQTIEVQPGPVVSFAVAQVCEERAVTFANQTTGEGITGYAWDFGDGGSFTSATAESPSYTFDDPGTYLVALSVTNELGCQNVYRQEITVYEQPAVGFVSDVACVGTPTQFTDTTTAGTNANVIEWRWDFGDGRGTASVRNPAYAYEQAGTYDVRLITQTTAGCTDSAVQTIAVESPVAAGFVATPQCPTAAANYRMLLSDTSTVAVGDEITRWFWTVGASTFVTQDVEYSFPAPGEYEVSLTAFAASGCNAIVRRTVQVDSLPRVDFTAPDACTGEPIAFQSSVMSYGQEITGYAWDFAGPDGQVVNTAFEANPSFIFDEAGNYEVTLTAQTADSCAFSRTQSVTVTATPTVAFTATPASGGAPLEVAFTNSSTDATRYAWDFGGLGTSDNTAPVFTFTERGSYVVTLTATNATGCTATTQQTITVRDPVQDIRLEEISVVDNPNGTGQRLLLSVRNVGSLPADSVAIVIGFGDAVSVREDLPQPLLAGETRVYVTQFILPKTPGSVRYLCATLTIGDTDFIDASPADNRNCVSLDEQLSTEAPFPNPVRDQLQLPVILPQGDAVSLRLIDSRGQTMRTYRQPNAPAGLNTFVIPTKGLPVGTYLLQMTYRGEQRQWRVGVAP